MIDSFGRKINYLRISVTDRCNLRCSYCMPADGISSKDHQNILRLEEILEIVQVFVHLGIEKIRLTGGEPLVRKGILELCQEIGKIPGIKDFAMTTNALLLENQAQALKDAGLQRINISLDTLNPHRYHQLTRGGSLEQALRGYEAAKKAGLSPIKINAVLLGGEGEQDIKPLIQWGMKEGLEIRFIELMPIGEALKMGEQTFISGEKVLQLVPELQPIGYTQGVAKLYKIPGEKGRVGLISPVNCKFCSDCNRLRLTADGFLKTCLHSNREMKLKGLTGEELRQKILQSVLEKEEMHQAVSLRSPSGSQRNMNHIGG